MARYYTVRDLIVVLTAPRPVSYLDDTLAALDRAGVQAADAERVLASDSLDALVSAGWEGIALAGPYGPLGNLRAFLAVLGLAQERGVDRLLFFEDDIVLCKNAIARMLATQVPDDCAFVSFFDMKEMPYGVPHGLYKVPTMGNDGRGYWGSQALLWPRRTIDYMLAEATRLLRGPNKQSSDCLFGYQLMLSPWPQYAIHVPNLVEHVGITSAIWSWIPKVNRQATSFPGEHFDAASLP